MIRTERLLLRRARMDDLDDLHRVFSDPRAMRYWSTLPHDHIDQTRDFLTGMIHAPTDTSADFVIERDGQAIGKAGSWSFEEIGFILHPDHWRQGIAHEALTAVIPYLFQTLPIARLFADVDPRNDASINLLTRLGFVETGRASRTFLLGDEWCDSVYLERTRPDDSPQGGAIPDPERPRS